MITTQYRRIELVIKVFNHELIRYDEKTKVYVPRNIVSSEIVKLQNSSCNHKSEEKKLEVLISFLRSQMQEQPNRSRFIQMDAKTVNEYFNDKVMTVYIENND